MVNWFCPKCGLKIEWCGSKPQMNSVGDEFYINLLYCKNCNANIEFTRLSD